jgi:hypothetical protein
VIAEFETCSGVGTKTFAQAPTWDDVAPIVAESCLSCHDTGGIAGISFATHEEASGWAAAMAADVAARTMPPFPARNCEDCRTYQDARWLDDDDVATIVAWAAGGAPGPAGADTRLTSTSAPQHLGDEADATLPIPAPYTPDASVLDDYHCFVVDPELPTDRFLTAVEVLPDQVQEVHHVLVYASTTEAGDAALAALEQDPDGDGTSDGYPCDGGPGVTDTALIAGWAPGAGVLRYPEGTGLLLPAGRKFIAQIHYNTANGVTADRTRVAVELAQTVDEPARFFRISAKEELVLPPGQPEVEVVRAEVPSLDRTAKVWGVAGHMHRLGTQLSVRSGNGECALDIPDYDFDWQTLYMFDEPYTAPAGDDVELRCTFDTTSVDTEVRWGESTEDEMCMGFLYVTGG